jgi:hypothetical protein
MRIRASCVPAATLALMGCAGAAVSSVGPRAEGPVTVERGPGPYAPAGTRLAVRLDQAIDSAQSSAQSTISRGFTARLLLPVRAPDGTVLARADARVLGEVASLGDPRTRKVRLRLLRVDTVAGPTPLWAAVHRVEYSTYPGAYRNRRPVPEPFEPYTGTPGALRPREYAPPVATGGGPLGTGTAAGLDGRTSGYDRAREIHLARGARLDLVLTRPLAPPRSPASR